MQWWRRHRSDRNSKAAVRSNMLWRRSVLLCWCRHVHGKWCCRGGPRGVDGCGCRRCWRQTNRYSRRKSWNRARERVTHSTREGKTSKTLRCRNRPAKSGRRGTYQSCVGRGKNKSIKKFTSSGWSGKWSSGWPRKKAFTCKARQQKEESWRSRPTTYWRRGACHESRGRDCGTPNWGGSSSD